MKKTDACPHPTTQIVITRTIIEHYKPYGELLQFIGDSDSEVIACRKCGDTTLTEQGFYAVGLGEHASEPSRLVRP